MYNVNTDIKITFSLLVPFVVFPKIILKHMTLQNGLRLEFILKTLPEYVLGLKERPCALIIQNATVYTCLIIKSSSLNLWSGVSVCY